MKTIQKLGVCVLMLLFSVSAFAKDDNPFSLANLSSANKMYNFSLVKKITTSYYSHFKRHYTVSTDNLECYYYLTEDADWTSAPVTVTTNITGNWSMLYDGTTTFPVGMTISTGNNVGYTNFQGYNLTQHTLAYVTGSGSMTPSTYNGLPIYLDTVEHAF